MGEPESLDTVEPLARHLARHDYDRLIMLSDGVFAIAMTLLVLTVKPDGEQGPLLSRLAPSLSAFALSFAVAAIFWLTHKRLFARLQRVDGRLTAMMLTLLGLVALLPASTTLIYQDWLVGEGRALYLGLVGLIGVVQAAAWAYAGFGAKLLYESVPNRVRVAAVISSAVMPIAFSSLTLYAAKSASVLVWIGALLVGAALLLLRNRFAGQPPTPPPSGAPGARS